MDVEGAIKLTFLMSRIVTRRSSGRPPKRQSCLERQFALGTIDITELEPDRYRYQHVRRNVPGNFC